MFSVQLSGDLPAVHLTCKRYQSVIDSKQFWKQRIETKWAEVTVEAATDEEEEDYWWAGLTVYSFFLVVDRVLAGSSTCELAVRELNPIF